jgi:hypothetical protein
VKSEHARQTLRHPRAISPVASSTICVLLTPPGPVNVTSRVCVGLAPSTPTMSPISRSRPMKLVIAASRLR